jgi:hypothetical protein
MPGNDDDWEDLGYARSDEGEGKVDLITNALHGRQNHLSQAVLQESQSLQIMVY